MPGWAGALLLRIWSLRDMICVVRGDSSERADGETPALGAEAQSGDRSLGVSAGSADLSSDLARVGSIPANRDVMLGALRLVTALASRTIEGADGVSVSLERHGELTTVAASNGTVRQMDAHQYGTGEGPCIAAATEGHWFHIESLAEEDRWPTFVPRAIEEGIASILSTPLKTASQPLGALNIYSNTERAFGTDQQELAALFATQASGILVDAGADVTDEQLSKRITDALIAREMIAHAQGVLMGREGLTAHGAAARLHRAARTAGVPVLQHATEIVASTRTEGRPSP